MSGILLTAFNADSGVKAANNKGARAQFNTFKTFVQDATAAQKAGDYNKLADAVGKFRGKPLGVWNGERTGFKNLVVPDFMKGKQSLPDFLRDLNGRSGKSDAEKKANAEHIDTFEKTLDSNKGDIGTTLDNLEAQVEKATENTQMSQVANESNQGFASMMPGTPPPVEERAEADLL